MMQEINFIPEQNKYLLTITFQHNGANWIASDYISTKQYEAAEGNDIAVEYLFNSCWEAVNRKVEYEDNKVSIERGDHYIKAGI